MRVPIRCVCKTRNVNMSIWEFFFALFAMVHRHFAWFFSTFWHKLDFWYNVNFIFQIIFRLSSVSCGMGDLVTFSIFVFFLNRWKSEPRKDSYTIKFTWYQFHAYNHIHLPSTHTHTHTHWFTIYKCVFFVKKKEENERENFILSSNLFDDYVF